MTSLPAKWLHYEKTADGISRPAACHRGAFVPGLLRCSRMCLLVALVKVYRQLIKYNLPEGQSAGRSIAQRIANHMAVRMATHLAIQLSAPHFTR